MSGPAHEPTALQVWNDWMERALTTLKRRLSAFDAERSPAVYTIWTHATIDALLTGAHQGALDRNEYWRHRPQLDPAAPLPDDLTELARLVAYVRLRGRDAFLSTPN